MDGPTFGKEDRLLEPFTMTRWRGTPHGSIVEGEDHATS
jgi:hypothetical protein